MVQIGGIESQSRCFLNVTQEEKSLKLEIRKKIYVQVSITRERIERGGKQSLKYFLKSWDL